MRGSRSTYRDKLMRERRGSILVWVGVLAVVLVAFGAMAVDFGSFYITANEVQTMTDASALAGARRLELSKADDPKPDVDAGAISAASANWVMGAQADIHGDNVLLKYWNDDTGEAEELNGRVANAVQVVDTAQTTFVFGNVFGNVWGRAAPNFGRGSVAWVASVTGAECMRPMAFNMAEVVQMLTGAKVARALTDEEIEAFKKLTPQQRTFVSQPPWNGVGNVPKATPDDGWAGLAFPKPNRGMSGYQDNLRGACQAGDPVSVGDSYDMPSAMTYAKTTEVFDGSGHGKNATNGLCNFGGATNHTCLDPATGTPGLRIPVVYGVTEPLKVFGRDGPVTVTMLGDVRIMCYVRTSEQPSGRCDWPAPGTSTEGWSEGTIVGIVEPNFGFPGGKVEYGNAPSLAKQLILVK